MTNKMRATIDGDTYYNIRNFLMTAETAIAEERRIYVWKAQEITEMIKSMNDEVYFSFDEVEV